MKNIKLSSILILTACVAALGSVSAASAETPKHLRMDIKAARADIKRLTIERKKAVRYHNWAKVAQEDRLIASDKLWILKDSHKIKHARG